MTTKPALQKILIGLLHKKEDIRVRLQDAGKNIPFTPSRTVKKD
jgi:hypothetical protein